MKTSSIVLLSILLMFSLSLYARGARQNAAPTVIQDDFTRYANGEVGSAWDTNQVGWEAKNHVLESDGNGRSLAVPLTAQPSRHVVIDVTITPHRAVGKEWKQAGLLLRSDDDNFWFLSLSENPDTKNSGHFAELSEMRAGVWLSQSNLPVAGNRGATFDWQYEHPYRFHLEVAPDGITGKISELDGTECVYLAYKFDAPAVTTGLPALITADLAAGFTDFRTSLLEPVPVPKQVFPPYTSAELGLISGKRTGFFHVEMHGDRWWIIDPQGHSFYAVGTDHVNYYAHFCEQLGYAPYNRNVEAKFGSEAKWAVDATARLKQWNFNTLGAGCIPSTYHKGLVHTEFLSLCTNFTAISNITPRTTWTGFADVFHPKFAAWCEHEARRLCAKHKDDPWLLGYFLDNELEWFGKNGSEGGLVDETFKHPADHPAKRALIAFLQKRYPDIEAFNRAWGVHLADWEALAHTQEPVATTTTAGKTDRLDFVHLIAERYFATTIAAIHKADPNHMVLGCRFAGVAPPGVIGIAGRYCDIVSVNYYGQVDMDRGISTDMPDLMRRYYTEAKRPLMQTEWSFPALDAGLPSLHGAGQRVATQTEKARCFRIYQEALFSLPFMVGSDYFMWADEPAQGISSTFPEDSNYGLVDVNDNAWKELTQTATHVNPLAQILHSGDTAELDVEIADTSDGHSPTVTVTNRGHRAADFRLRVWVQGKESTSHLSLAPGAASTNPITIKSPAFIAAMADPEESVPEVDRSHNHAFRVVNAILTLTPSVIVINPTDHALSNVPVSVPLGKLGMQWTVKTPGVGVQMDDLPLGPELALQIPDLPARSVRVFPLTSGTMATSHHDSGGDHSFSLDGPLKLEHDVGSGDFFDHISLGDVALGHFRPVIHEVGDQPMWVAPDHIVRIDAFQGPVRTVLFMTAELGSADSASVTTAAGPAGVYAPRSGAPKRFQTTYRLSHNAGETWFTSRFLSLKNTDMLPWHFAEYYHYALSAIGGDAANDQPRNSSNASMWFDASAGISYGGVVEGDLMKASFWKDTPDGPGEHADIRREINLDLKPGQIVAATAADSDVFLFGAHGTDTQPAGDTLDRLKSLAKVRAILVSAGTVRH